MAKYYRSARGKGVDLSQILNDNEHVRAVGNMNVNARGDTVDSANNTIQSRNDRVKNQYRKQHKSVAHADPVPTSKQHAERLAKEAAKAEAEKPAAQRIAEEYTQSNQTVTPPEPKPYVDAPQTSEVAQPATVVDPMVTEMKQAQPAPVAPEPQAVADVPVNTEEPVKMKAESVPKGKGGLAAAIAKARESKQELMKTERQQARESDGVKRI